MQNGYSLDLARLFTRFVESLLTIRKLIMKVETRNTRRSKYQINAPSEKKKKSMWVFVCDLKWAVVWLQLRHG